MMLCPMRFIWLTGKKNVRNNVSSESVVLGKLNWDASYTPPSWGNPKYLLHRTIKIGRKYGSYGKVLEAVTKIGKVLNQINAPKSEKSIPKCFLTMKTVRI